ncbi:hypothetical protein ABT116_50110, partial [Streptomyces sp. NPDC002130]
MSSISDTIEQALTERELDFTRKDDAHFVVELPGEHKLKTTAAAPGGRSRSSPRARATRTA